MNKVPVTFCRRKLFLTIFSSVALTAATVSTSQAGFGPGGIPIGGGRANGTAVWVDAPVDNAHIQALKNFNPPWGTNPFRGKTDQQIRDLFAYLEPGSVYRLI